MKIFFYRSTENDEDGDPYDWGAVKSDDRDTAIARIKEHLNEIGVDFIEAFYFYEPTEPQSAGMFRHKAPRETIYLRETK
jgi:hypothetical protein